MRPVIWSAVLGICLSSNLFAQEIKWERQKLEDIFRLREGVTAFDVNHDGKIDVINGEAWYEAPNWTLHEISKLGKYDGATGYSQTACWGYDVNADGWTDLIAISFPGVPFHWFENPKNEAGHWKKHEIWHSACNETPQFLDVTGDGKPEIILGSNPEEQMGYLEIPSPDKVNAKWQFTPVSVEKSIGTHKFYHGLGVGDVNRDGRLDIVIPQGWWEGPEQRNNGPWTFHPLKLGKDEKGDYLPAADIYVDDLDLDGDQDIVMSSAHGNGIWWFENVGSNSEPKYKYHLIDEHYSQTHALHYVDINGDGEKDLVTGKRFYAHGPKGDPDPLGEVVIYWYEIHKTKGQPPKFTPHKIEAGKDTGIGTQFFVGDIDGNKSPDIVLSNKKGTNVLLSNPSK
ncbi:MAG: VCBS repeat-containing protein [Planctomycetales bacterium]